MASRQKAKLRQTGPAEPYSDLGSSLRWQHDPALIDNLSGKENTIRKRARVYSHNPLETYFRRKIIDYKQKSAGEILGRLWQSSAIEPRVIGVYQEYVNTGHSGNGAAARKTEAYERWRQAMATVGPIAGKEVTLVCCTEEPLRGAAQIEIMRRGLDVLVKHFGV